MDRNDASRHDGFIEMRSEIHPIHKMRRENTDGKIKEWICVETEVFQEIISQKHINEKQEDPKMLFHQIKDDPVREEIAANIEKAVKKRTKRGTKTEFLKKIADFYAYDEIDSVRNGLSMRVPMHVEDILHLERDFDFQIHRDEILGEIIDGAIGDKSDFRKLYLIMEMDPNITQPMNKVLNLFHHVLVQSSDWADRSNACDDIEKFLKKYIKKRKLV